jgi:phosphoribosylformimino-5-aminoimidazole carboxamide ribotide isomerase
MRIIPAIDIIEGKCVRLSKGDYSTKKVYNEDPLEVALAFEAHGVRYLHLVDLDGARSNHIVNHKILESISSGTNLRVDFGGGLKTDEDLKIAFNSGAAQVTGGSIALKDRETFGRWIATYGPEKIILGADAREEKIAVNGWQEGSDADLIPFIQEYVRKGICYVICTDIARDGMLEGPAFDLYRKILRKTAGPETTVGISGVVDKKPGDLNLIASGGISAADDLYKLKSIGCEGAIIGKAIYENRISLKELENFILTA